MSGEPGAVPRRRARAGRIADGRVTLERVEAGTHAQPGHGGIGLAPPPRIANRSRFAVVVDGVRRGHLYLPAGFGARWCAESLGDLRPETRSRDIDRPIDLSGFNIGGAGRDELAAMFVGWMAEGKAPSSEEMEAARVKAREKDAEADAAWDAQQEKARAESAARRARTASAARQAAERLAFTIEGLTSIMANLRPQMSNAEAAALQNAIDDLRARRGA